MDAPNESWVTDITYIWTTQGWLYSAVIMDLFSRKIIGLDKDQYLKKELATTSLERALMFRNPPEGLLHYSDRGTQYTSKNYIEILTEDKMEISMSNKIDCFDNACVESFFATLKRARLSPNKYEKAYYGVVNKPEQQSA